MKSIQRRALKIIRGHNSTGCGEECSNFNLSPLADRRTENFTEVYVYKEFLKSLFLMAKVIYTLCYLLHAQIPFTDFESIYSSSLLFLYICLYMFFYFLLSI